MEAKERVLRKKGHQIQREVLVEEEKRTWQFICNLRENSYKECQERKPQKIKLRGEYVARKYRPPMWTPPLRNRVVNIRRKIGWCLKWVAVG